MGSLAPRLRLVDLGQVYEPEPYVGLSELYDIAVMLWLPGSEVSCVFEILRPVLAKRAFPVDLLIVNLISFGLFFFVVSTGFSYLLLSELALDLPKSYTYISNLVFCAKIAVS